MPFIPVANTALSELRYTANGQQCENTLWFEFPTDPAASDLDDLNVALLNWWTASLAPITSSGVELREITSTSMTTASSPQSTLVPAGGQFGGSTPNIVSNNVTMSISFRTALRGRSFRGRNYTVGHTEDQVTGNSFAAGVSALWQAGFEDLIAAAAAAGWEWVVVSRFSGVSGSPPVPTPRAAGITTPVTAVVVVDNFVDSQRRRLTGRGN